MGAAPKLKIFKDGAQVMEETIEGKVEIGRGQDCVIRLDDRAISRKHLSLRPVDGGLEIEKKSEFAPLSVNGAECTRAIVKVGDVIQIGPYQARLEAPPAPAPAPAPAPPPSPTPTAVAAPATAQVAAPTAVLDPPTAILPENGGPEIAPVEGAGGLDLQPLDTPAAEAPPAETAGGALELGGLEGAEIPAADLGAAPAEEAPAEMPMEEAAPLEAPAEEAPEAYPSEDGATRITSAANLKVMLLLEPGKANVTELEITGNEVVIGRSKNCDIVLEDKKSSRKHAIVRRAGMNFIVKDLGAANGTYLNGVKIQEQELSGDDVIRIGDTEIRFQALSADYQANQAQYESVPESAEQVVGEMPQDQGQPMPMAGMEGGLMVPPPDGALMAPPGGDLGQPLGGVVQGAPIGSIPGVGPSDGGNKSLLAKFRSMDPAKRKKLILYIVVGAIAFDFMWDEDQPPPKPKQAQGQAKKKIDPKANPNGKLTFEELSDEKKRFVMSQHALAFEKYRNQDYDQAIYEISKIFELVDDYKNSREIERYAREGKRKMDALEEEKKKKDEEQRLKDKIAELIDEAGKLMAQKAYDQAEPVFGQILALDPENKTVAGWQHDIQQFRDEEREKAEAAEIREKINQNARDVLKEGVALKEKGKVWEAIEKLGKVKSMGATDKTIAEEAETKIDEIRAEIKAKLDPLISDAKSKEDAGNYGDAYRLYDEASKVDPRDHQGLDGMDRIRAALNEKAKALYVEGVVAESYSDFSQARKVFEEIVRTAPPGSIYHDRAKAKLRKYVMLPPDGDGGPAK